MVLPFSHGQSLSVKTLLGGTQVNMAIQIMLMVWFLYCSLYPNRNKCEKNGVLKYSDIKLHCVCVLKYYNLLKFGGM